MNAKISFNEVRDITICVIVLGFLFSFGSWGETKFDLEIGVQNWIFSCLIVGLAFVAHELAHKFVAQSYEARAEFRIWPQGLVLSIFLAFISNGSLIFAAPGFVVISTAYFTRIGYKYVHLSNEEKGKIALAGPLAGLGIAVLAKLLQPLLPEIIFLQVLQINAWIALFNLIPFPPLDGSKVIMWSRGWWLSAVLSTSLALFLFPTMSVWLSLLVIGVILGFTFIVVQKAKI
ncbi:MAG: hypothetical protein GOU97_01760 [Nanoarchaeota archaeon]|nr:hypothetical protein [Nanoarchaeota archaeon]